MRKGDPHIASSSKTWTQTHRPFGSPVTRSLDGLHQGDAPNRVAQPTGKGTDAAVTENQRLTGDFNVSNGGKWITTKPNF